MSEQKLNDTAHKMFRFETCQLQVTVLLEYLTMTCIKLRIPLYYAPVMSWKAFAHA